MRSPAMAGVLVGAARRRQPIPRSASPGASFRRCIGIAALGLTLWYKYPRARSLVRIAPSGGLMGERMTYIALMLVFLAGAVAAPRLLGRLPVMATLAVRAGCLFVALVFLLETSFVSVPADRIGVMRKIYGGKTLEAGRVIAADGETG